MAPPIKSGNTRPLVSVVIAARDAQRFLLDALLSIAAQTYAPVEVVVVDDGSTDDTAAVATAYAESVAGVTVFSQRNQGPSAARNTGIASTAGEFVTFLDADDEMLPGRIERQLLFLESAPEYDAVIVAQEVVLEAGVTPPPWYRRALEQADPYVYLESSMMVRRAALDRVGGFDPDFPVSEDVDLLWRLAATGGGYARLNEVLVRRRLHGDNLTYQDAELERWRTRSVGKIARAKRVGLASLRIES